MLPLPDSWIERIFEKLSVTYGRAFWNQYEGIAMDVVKANWAHELAGFANHPEGIKHALLTLPPDRPPNVLQFRAIAQKAPPPVFKALPSPPADPERVRAHIAAIKAKLTHHTTKGNPNGNPVEP